MLVIFLTSLIISAAVPITFYVLYSVGLSTMLKRTGFKKPWFAWLPFCRDFALGGLADQHRDIFPPKKRGQKLLILSILAFVLGLIYNIAYYNMALPIMKQYLAPFINAETIDTTLLLTAFENMSEAILAASTTSLTVLELLADISSVAYVVYRIMILVRVFRIFDQGRALLYTVLSVFIDPACGIIFFIIRNKPLHNLRWQTEEEPEIPKL